MDRSAPKPGAGVCAGVGRNRKCRFRARGLGRGTCITSTRSRANFATTSSASLAAPGIQTAIHYPEPIHLMAPYRDPAFPPGQSAERGTSRRGRFFRCRFIRSCPKPRWKRLPRQCGQPQNARNRPRGFDFVPLSFKDMAMDRVPSRPTTKNRRSRSSRPFSQDHGAASQRRAATSHARHGPPIDCDVCAALLRSLYCTPVSRFADGRACLSTAQL